MEMARVSRPFATLCVAQGKKDQGPMTQLKSCCRADCANCGVTSLGEEALCFDHFCSRCYELLEQADRRTVYPWQRNAGWAELALRLDECARRALEISLSQIELNNLDRARLLDIVLWSGDLTSLLRRRHEADLKGAREESQPELFQGATRSGRVN